MNKGVAFLKFFMYKILFISSLKGPYIGLFFGKVLIKTKKCIINHGSRFICNGETELIAYNNITIGSNVTLNNRCRIVSMYGISIGDNVLLANDVSIIDHNHNFFLNDSNMVFDGYYGKQIVIGSNVWIGEKVIILKGVTIGNNVVIGAGTIVRENIPSNSVFYSKNLPCIRPIRKF
jgi:acetyltransferase-like isoleucine patch superfamily enzyme